MVRLWRKIYDGYHFNTSFCYIPTKNPMSPMISFAYRLPIIVLITDETVLDSFLYFIDDGIRVSMGHDKCL